MKASIGWHQILLAAGLAALPLLVMGSCSSVPDAVVINGTRGAITLVAKDGEHPIAPGASVKVMCSLIHPAFAIRSSSQTRRYALRMPGMRFERVRWGGFDRSEFYVQVESDGRITAVGVDPSGHLRRDTDQPDGYPLLPNP